MALMLSRMSVIKKSLAAGKVLSKHCACRRKSRGCFKSSTTRQCCFLVKETECFSSATWATSYVNLVFPALFFDFPLYRNLPVAKCFVCNAVLIWE